MRFEGSGFRVQGSGFIDDGVECRVQGLRFMDYVYGLRLKALGSRL